MKRSQTGHRLGWARLGVVALLGVILIGATDAWSATQRGRGGARGGARMSRGHHRVGSAPRYRGSMRSSGRGSMRHHQPSRRSPGVVRPSGSRYHAARPPAARPGGHRPPTPPGARNPISRTGGYGSIRGRENVNRSIVDRRRHAATNLPNVDHRPIDPDRVQRRRALRRAARRYSWRGSYWWYDDGYWWQPYYDGGEQWYEQVYPPAGLGLEELPEGAVPVEGEEGLFVANGVYYRLQPDGTYAIVERPDTGLPDPVTIARRSLDFIAEQPAFEMTVIDSIDYVQDNGQKIQSETKRVFQLRRPDAVAVTADGDDVNRLFWYDGKEMTIVDQVEKVAARTKAPDTIDEMLDFVVTQLSVDLPLLDLLYSDPLTRVEDAMGGPEYLGISDVDGAPCHHLSFSTRDADWQLWVDSGENPAPVMLAISYVSAPETPTYRARFEKWDFAPAFTDATFAASIPEGVEEIPFTTPQSEVDRIQAELDQHQKDNQRIADHIAAQRTIDLFSRIANKPDAQERIDAEKARQAKLGDVSQEEIDAYETRRKELRRELDEARGTLARTAR